MSRRVLPVAMIALAATFWIENSRAADVMSPNATRAGKPAAEPAADSMPLLLQVVINGFDTAKVAEFIEQGGTLLSKASELNELRLKVPLGAAGADALIALGTLAGVQYRIDRSAQTLYVTATNEALLPSPLQTRASGRPAAPVQSGFGATMNYDLVGTSTAGDSQLSGQFDLRGFSSWGVASTGLLVIPEPNAANSQKPYRAVRLDSAWTFSDPDSLERYRAGDFINGGLGWSRPVRLGGAQFALDFSLRPDLVTIPLPTISGAAAVPSTVDMLVNGVKTYTGAVQPGPFIIPQLPVSSGASNVTLAVTDALGRQVVTEIPFYTGGGLLDTGLQTVSLEVGAVRLGYGTLSNDYGSTAVSGTWRRGLSDVLTLETHAEATTNLFMGGAGGVLNVGNLGLFNFGLAGSASSGRGGLLVEAGFTRQAQHFSISVNAIWAQHHFSDIAAQNFDPEPTLRLNAGFGIQFSRFGSLSISYNRIDQSGPLEIENAGLEPAQRVQLGSASYSVQFGTISLHANAFHDFQSGSTGAIFGITIPLGDRGSASASSVLDSARPYAQLESSRSVVEVGDYGYQFFAAEGGAQSHQFVNGQYKSSIALLSAGGDVNQGQASIRLEAQGAVSALDAGIFASPPVNDAFAVVDTNGLANVHVLRENRIVGETDSHGQVFVPDLRSFEANHLAVDPNDVPPDINISSPIRDVRPQDRSGVVVSFDIRRSHGAILHLVDEAGLPIPFGSAARLDGTGATVPIGYDGESYVEYLAPRNRLDVSEPDGKRCVAVFAYNEQAGEIPEIGPISCRLAAQ